MMKLTIVRHGESQWNKLNLFTGFRNIDLSVGGIHEAIQCGQSLDQNFDIAFTSTLARAYKTCEIISEYSDKAYDIIKSNKLNERDYGDLTGKNKKEMVELYGEDQVQLWRRSVDVKPPNGENLLDVIERVAEFFNEEIKPQLDNGKNVLVVAHGNSIRALLVVIGVFNKDVISQFEIPTGKPIFIDYQPMPIEYESTHKYKFTNEYSIIPRQILDSRGNPTVEAELYNNHFSVIGTGSSPSGASTGSNEAMELRDNNPDLFMGKSVFNSINNLKALNNLMYLDDKTLKNLIKCDNQLMFIDGTQLKKNIGGNTTTAASFMFADAGANLSRKPLYQYLADIYSYPTPNALPVPMVNILNGGKHAGGNLKIQEFMIMPTDSVSFVKRTEYVFNVYNCLKKLLKNTYGPSSINLGDEGGFAPNLNTPNEALNIIEEAIIESGLELGTDITLALDCAASEFYDSETGTYEVEVGKNLSSAELVEYYGNLIKNHPALKSIEDAFDEKDYNGWIMFNKLCGNSIMIVGDDLFTTNPKIIKKGMDEKWANSLLLKVNQIGTITEAVQAAKIMQGKGCDVIVSHRSGETNSALISDLAVGIHAKYIKLGAPARGERVAKYNRLLHIEENMNM